MLMRLPGKLEQNDGRKKSERNRNHDDQGRSPVAQEQEKHQPGESGSGDAFTQDRRQRIANELRLIELISDLDVFRHQRLKSRKILTNLRDDGKGRGVRPFGDRDVDGSLSVQQSVARQKVG